MVTVGLPAYNQIEIAWLAMEGLCNQKTTENWELIIAEEIDKGCGEAYYFEYMERLREAGCISMTYIPFDEHTALSHKWRIIAHESFTDSLGLILQGSDDYSNPNRIQSAYESLLNNDWVHSKNGLFYDIPTGRKMISQIGYFKTGVDIAVKMDLARQLPKDEVWRGVDTWMMDSICKFADIQIYVNESDDWKQGVFTSGMNTLSHRDLFFDTPSGPYLPTELELDLPTEIIERLSCLVQTAKVM